MSNNVCNELEIIESTLEFFSQTDLKKIVSNLITKNIVQKSSNLFDEITVVQSNKTNLEIVKESLAQNFEQTLNVINEIEINKVFKYGSMFEIKTNQTIDEVFLKPLEVSMSLTNNVNLKKYQDLFLIVFYETLRGVKLNSNNIIENHYLKYPTIVMLHPDEKILDIKVPTVPRMFQNDQRNFYQKRIAEIRDFLVTTYEMSLQPLDLYTLTNNISEENNSDVKVSSQKMQLASGGNATLDSGLDSEEIILPILGELTKIIDDNKDLFNQSEESIKIKDLLEEFISETKETSELPWMSLRWPHLVKARNVQVKFLFNHYDDSEFTMMQFYNNSRGMEGMRYVAKYLIEKYQPNSSGTSDNES